MSPSHFAPTSLQAQAPQELTASNAAAFRDQMIKLLDEEPKVLEIDMSRTTFLDSSGLGALVGLQKTASRWQGSLTLLDPLPAVRQIIELTRLNRLFNVVSTASNAAA
jgi:anti-sigma B factor antagonist